MKETKSEDPLSFAVRPYTAEDDAFLYELYCSTRGDEVALLGWNDAQKDMFLRMQFHAQQQPFRVYDNVSEHWIILVDEMRAGRMLVFKLEDEIRLADIALLPQYRNRGIGESMIRDLQMKAESAGKLLSLHVAHSNPAQRLYQRLGFVSAGDGAAHVRMEWKRG
jgi:ribosomal protein S18 acetylase RimI-like enzyme